MKYNNTKRFRKKLKYQKKERDSENRRFSIKKKQIQIPNFLLAERILKGTVNLEALKEVQNKKILRNLQGRHSDISLEKLVIKNVKDGKRQRMKKIKEGNKEARENAERMAFFKLKKEPEKNKTHWDHLIEEMKWMQNDFEKERKLKKKKSAEFCKFAKKSLDTRHLEVEKKVKKQEQDLRKMAQTMARSVNNYWKKIEKLTKHHYNAVLQENKMAAQQNRLLGFINKLQKISGRVAESLPDKNLLKGTGQGIQALLGSTLTQNLISTQSTTMDNLSSTTDENIQMQNIDPNEEIIITVKKLEDGTYSIIENEENETLVAKAAEVAEKFQPKGTELSQANINLEQPFLLKHTLREYQLIGLHWLIALHDNKINGILADEMGLGKTIQTISLLAYLAGKRGNWGPHLIIVPTTIIINWEIEFKKWCPGLKILSYYGNQKERKAKRYGWHKPNAFNVCITSYKLVIQDYSIFKRKRWYYIILDEAQNIKNFKSKRWQMLLNFKSKRKLLLTGTPLQNDVMEIWSYLHFLMPNLFYSNEEFRDWFYSQFYNAIHNNAALNKKMIQSLHSILRPFLLRRLKKDVEKQLPEKIEHVVYCELTRRQKYLYDEYINSDKIQDTLKHNDYFSIMNVLMQLRKVCNHPDLFDTRDYITPSKQIFDINITAPEKVIKALAYNPMKTINYKHLNFIIEENEKLGKYEYNSLIRNFPSKPLYEIYDEINRKEKLLYSNKYLIDENDILFKRQYVDSTILYNSNTEEVKCNFNYNNFRPRETSSGTTNLGYASSYNLPLPNYVTPTNIPLLTSTSMAHYFDVLYPIDTLNLGYSAGNNRAQEYLKSAFEDNFDYVQKIKREFKKKILHFYDLISRKNMLFKSPVYGSDLQKTFKLTFALLYPHLIGHTGKNQIIYGENYHRQQDNLINNVCLNKGFKYLMNKGELAFTRNVTWEEVNLTEEEQALNKNSEMNLIKIHEETSDYISSNKNNEQADHEKLIDDNLSQIKLEDGQQESLKIEIEENKIYNDINMNKEEPHHSSVKEDVTNEINPPTKRDFSKIPHINSIHSQFSLNTSFTPSDSVNFLNSDAIQNLILTPPKMLSLCDDLMSNFRIHIPKVISKGPQLICSKTVSDFEQSKNRYRMLYNNLNRIPNVQKYFSMFKIISFPDKNLVEFDSGKLIKLAQLLKRLKSNKSKVLIFTQMTRMLDILERFLSLHGYTYVRLDGSTKVEVRQQVVDRFNNDPKVFCFISSTRSGGIGLNLTGADSIVFFDTDWNPAMDKQAQDRCHRIGQTRTVHIYRLITLSTIEENIFRKSIQKRELNYVIMEDGKFDMNNFKKINYKNLIQEENLLKDRDHDMLTDAIINRKEDKIKKLLEFENLAFENEEEQRNIEQMLIRIEDQEDVQALKNLSKEMLDEYEKENNELQFIKDEDENKDKENKDLLKDPRLLNALKGIDKFALKHFQNQYPFDDFIREKESKTNQVLYRTPEDSEVDLDEELEIGQSDNEGEKVSKLDLDQAYEMYLSKKKDILRTFELMAGAAQNEEGK